MTVSVRETSQWEVKIRWLHWWRWFCYLSWRLTRSQAYPAQSSRNINWNNTSATWLTWVSSSCEASVNGRCGGAGCDIRLWLFMLIDSCLLMPPPWRCSRLNWKGICFSLSSTVASQPWWLAIHSVNAVNFQFFINCRRDLLRRLLLERQKLLINFWDDLKVGKNSTENLSWT